MRWLCLLVVTSLAACTEAPVTEILVVVDTDIASLDEVTLSARVAGETPTEMSSRAPELRFPLSFALLHGGGALGPLHVEVAGAREGKTLVVREAEAAFAIGQILVLRMDLFAGCAALTCGEGLTCTETGCAPIAEASRLRPWTGALEGRPPWQPAGIDATVFDGGVRDGSVAPDGGVDGGAEVDSRADASDPVDTAEPIEEAIGSLGTCGVFPGNDVWLVDVRGHGAAARSAAYISGLGGAGTKLAVGFGTNQGVVWRSVDDAHPLHSVELNKPNVKVNWPVPASFPLIDSPAARIVVVDRSRCLLFEALGCQRVATEYFCQSGGAVALNGGWARQPGSVLAQDSALALMPGLVRLEEVAAGKIEHALSVAAGPLRQGFVAPALNHVGGNVGDENLAPMGVRLRLRADYPEEGLGAAAKIIVQALKTHGAIITHRGGGIELLGERRRDWPQLDLSGLESIGADDFVVLAHGPISL